MLVAAASILDGVPLVGLSAPVLLGLVVMMILTGRLVPKSTVDEVRKDRDTWHSAHSISETARAESMKQVDELLGKAQHTDEVLTRLADIIVNEKTTGQT